MTNSVTQILQEYEVLGMSLEEIAEVEGLLVPAVKSILLANSPKYRADSTEKKELDFNPSDEELALGVIRRVAQYSEDDHTALKAAMFIRNDKKGRLDVKAGIKNIINRETIFVLNEHFAKATAAIAGRILPAKQLEQTTVTEI